MGNEGGLGQALRGLPLAHKVVIGIAAAVMAMAGFLFMQWVSTPSYTVLYSGLDDATVSEVVAELDRTGVDYKIEAGGSRILVQQSQAARVRADLTGSGVVTGLTPQGYELLDDQGLNASDFRQQVDYQRALEGELAKTLAEMEAITGATVHLVLPEDSLFIDEQREVSASVLLSPARTLSALEIETVTFLVSSSVDGLEPAGVTVADVSGNVLHAAGDLAGTNGLTNRNLRMARDFELILATDVERLLDSAVGTDLATVVVRADLDFDESTVQSETYDPDASVTISEQVVTEVLSGSGESLPEGAAGVDGDAAEAAAEAGVDAYDYSRSEQISQNGVNRTVTTTINAPGRINSLSVAVVMDDGSLTGATVPSEAEVQDLLIAALGMDTARGDSVAVTAVPFPAPVAVDEADLVTAPPANPMMDLLPQAIGGVVLVIVAIALLLMSRKGKKKDSEVAAPPVPAALPQTQAAAGQLVAVGQPATVGAANGNGDVTGLIEQQPDEIAVLLRGWLADRR